MSDPTSTKDALLGELESIKGLLDDEDFNIDEIPVLVDDISLFDDSLDSPSESSFEGSSDSFAEIKPDSLETSTVDDMLEETTAEISAIAFNTTVPNEPSPYNQFGTQPLEERQNSNSLTTPEFTAKSQPENPLPPGVLPGQQPLFEELLPPETANIQEPNQGNAILNNSADTDLEASLKKAYANYYTDDTPASQIESEHQAAVQETDLTELKNDEAIPEIPAHAGEPETPGNSANASTAEPTALTGAEIIRQQAPHLSGLASSPMKELQETTQTAASKSTSTSASSNSETTGASNLSGTSIRRENPFLPKHIRDRLHTQKSLPDLIRDETAQWQPGTLSSSVTQKIVDNLVAEYMPQIETELRSRLMRILEGKTDQTSNKIQAKPESSKRI